MIGEAQSMVERKGKVGGVKEMLQTATKLTHKLRFLVEEVRHSPCVCVSKSCQLVHVNLSYTHMCTFTLQPQHTVPDVFVWLLSNNKRVACARVRTRDLLFSNDQEAKGIHCGKIITLYLRVNTHTQNLKLKYFSVYKSWQRNLACVCLCAASRQACCCRLVSPSKAGCVSVVWNQFRLQPHAGQHTWRFFSRHRGRWCKQPSNIPEWHRWETDTLSQYLSLFLPIFSFKLTPCRWQFTVVGFVLTTDQKHYWTKALFTQD